MSLITRCPACATQFKVVPEQLKLSDGWVRCGHCSDVFDATRYLQGQAPEAAQPKPPATQQAPVSFNRERSVKPRLRRDPSTPAQTVASSSPVVPDAVVAINPETDVARRQANDSDSDLPPHAPDRPRNTDPSPSRDVGPPTPTPDPLHPATAAPVDRNAAPASDFQIELERFAADQAKPPAANPRFVSVNTAAHSQPKLPSPSLPLTPPPLAPLVPSSPSPQQAPPAAKDVLPLPDTPEGGLSASEPGFVRQARQRAFWRSPSVRALLTLVVLLLSAVLVGQWALHERDRLAARHPDWQPLLARLCEPLGCTIGAVRDLQAVVIESATLTRRIGDFYSFDLVLKNTSTTALAVPALELSLTDAADTVVSRRVFLPDELAGVPPLLPPQSTVPVSLRLSLSVGELSMAGYRALVFYP